MFGTMKSLLAEGHRQLVGGPESLRQVAAEALHGESTEDVSRRENVAWLCTTRVCFDGGQV